MIHYTVILTTQLKIVSCINLQPPIVILAKFNSFRHVSSYNVHVHQFSANWVSMLMLKIVGTFNRNRVHKFICQKIVSPINLQLPTVKFKKLIISDKHML